MFETRRAKNIQKNFICAEWWTDGFNSYFLYPDVLAMVVTDLDGACYAVEYEDSREMYDEWSLLKEV